MGYMNPLTLFRIRSWGIDMRSRPWYVLSINYRKYCKNMILKRCNVHTSKSDLWAIICHSIFTAHNIDCTVAMETKTASPGLLTRYVNFLVAHAPGMPETSQHTSRYVRHARALMHMGIANPLWREKRSRHSRRMRNTQFCVSDNRLMAATKKLWHYNAPHPTPPRRITN